MEELVQIFKALGDETRLEILIILSRRKICAKGLAKHLGISEAAVSQHISMLKQAGLIKGEKIGYFVQYEVQKQVLARAAEFIGNIDSEFNFFCCKSAEDMSIDCSSICKSNRNKCCKK